MKIIRIYEVYAQQKDVNNLRNIFWELNRNLRQLKKYFRKKYQ